MFRLTYLIVKREIVFIPLAHQRLFARFTWVWNKHEQVAPIKALPMDRSEWQFLPLTYALKALRPWFVNRFQVQKYSSMKSSLSLTLVTDLFSRYNHSQTRSRRSHTRDFLALSFVQSQVPWKMGKVKERSNSRALELLVQWYFSKLSPWPRIV